MSGGGQIPVAGVGLGDQSKFGTATVANTAATVAPEGFNAGKVSFQTAVYLDGQNGAGVWFAFDQPYNNPLALNTPFTFGGDLVITGASVGDETRFGIAYTFKTAKDAFPSGWDSAVVPKPKIYFAGANGAGVDFPFAEAYTPPLQLNTPFYFGGDPVVTGVTLGDLTLFGSIQEIRKPPQLFVSSIFTEVVGKPRLGATGSIDFVFSESYTQPPSQNVPYYFGGQPSVSATLGRTDVFGNASVVNSAKTVAPEGVEPGIVPRPKAFFQNQNGAAVNFKFEQDYNGQTALNTPFYFAGFGNFNPGGIDPPEPGVPNVRNEREFITPVGFTLANRFGVTRIGRPIEASGFISDQYGTPDIYNVAGDTFGDIPPGDVGSLQINQRLNLEGFDAGTYGKPGISPQFVRPAGWVGAIGSVTFTQTLTTRTVVPAGFTSYALGAVKVDPRFVYPTGFPSIGASARFGNPRVQLATLYAAGIPPGDFPAPRVDDGKQFVTVPGLAAPAFPQPVVVGRWEYVYPSSLPTSAIFGDLNVRLNTRAVRPSGWQSSQFPGFQPNVYNRNQLVLPFGWLSPGAFYARPYVYNYAWQIIPFGQIGPEQFGTGTDVGLLLKYVLPAALDSAKYGTATVVNAARAINLAGQGITGAFGTAAVTRRVREIRPVGRSFGEYGDDHFVDFANRRILDAGGIFAFLPSTGTVVESTIRRLDFSTFGVDTSSFGTPTTWFRVRYVAPPPLAYAFTWEQFGRFLRVEYALKRITGFGWQSSRFGTTDVRRNEFIVQPESFTGAMGVPDVQWYRRPVFARTVGDTSAFGTAWVSDSPRYVYQFIGDDDYLFMGGVGVPTNVENQNKTIGAFGWRSSRFSSGNFIDNNARVLTARGTDTALYGRPFVSDALRYVTTIGHESSRVDRWSNVYNYTRRIEPSGIPRLFVGVPFVWSNTQYVDFVNAPNLFTLWGNAFVAHAVRTVSLDLQPGALLSGGIAPPPYNVPFTHYVGLFRQLVAPPGLPPPRVGDHVFEIKFNILKPWGNDMSLYGEAQVRNVTPEVRPLAWQEFEMVWTHYVGLYTRSVSVERFSIPPPHEFLPRPVVEFRTKTIRVPGINSLRIPLLHDVRFDVPSIQPPQQIFVESVPNQTGGPNPEAAAFGAVFVRRHPRPEGWVSSRFSSGTWVRVQGCSPLWDWPSSEFGTPSLNPPERVRDAGGIRPLDIGKPGISPHTIWCTSDAPQQAIDNHPGDPWLDIDADGKMLNRNWEPAYDVQWGMAFVSLRTNRRITVFHSTSGGFESQVTGERFGRFEASNWIRQIFPDGFRRGRFGFPELPTQLEVFAGGMASRNRWGVAEVSLGPPPPSNRTVSAVGHRSSTFGSARLELFNRTIFPVGSRMDVFGDNNPMVYFPRGAQSVGGLDAVGWGDNRVEFKDRVIYTVGHDSFVMDYDIMAFNDRLRIYKLFNPVDLAGFDSAVFGTATAKLATQVIAPYQIEAPRCLGHDIYILEEA